MLLFRTVNNQLPVAWCTDTVAQEAPAQDRKQLVGRRRLKGVIPATVAVPATADSDSPATADSRLRRGLYLTLLGKRLPVIKLEHCVAVLELEMRVDARATWARLGQAEVYLAKRRGHDPSGCSSPIINRLKLPNLTLPA